MQLAIKEVTFFFFCLQVRECLGIYGISLSTVKGELLDNKLKIEVRYNLIGMRQRNLNLISQVPFTPNMERKVDFARSSWLMKKGFAVKYLIDICV